MKLILSLIVAALLGCVLVVELAEINYNLAICKASRSAGSDSAHAEIMQKYGFKDSTGCEVLEPARAEKIQALIISL